ncbi:flagellar motor protein [Paenibacillus sp. YYML68]|uniref:flagellar motor protein n=1 Tax=Paenibacillus sp. YYML68 TaxID=2909250 RepID=UPI002491B057|nr:flagellar motor protein [Paenibacillus sp. YYML68]
MDLITIIGIVVGIGALTVGYMMDGGHLSGLFVPSALIIIFGGTIGAVLVSFPLKQVKQLGSAVQMAFLDKQTDPLDTIDEFYNMTLTARREGVLALEDTAQEHPNAFIRDGLQLVVDGTDPEQLREILELEIEAVERKHEGWAKMFEAAGGYAPTMGILGTVLGLIHVLGNLEDPSKLGPAIAVAFTATLYGVGSANLLFLPIASKIKSRSAEHVLHYELMLEGLLSLQAGVNPVIIKKKLLAYVQVQAKPAAKDGESLGEE